MIDKMHLFSLKGWKGSGKTTLLCRLIEHCTFSPIGAVKVSSHVPLPHGGDTERFSRSGADTVCLIEQREVGEIRTFTDLYHRFPLLKSCRIIFCEGFIIPDYPSGVIYAGSSIFEGIKEGHDEADMLIYDGEPATREFLTSRRNHGQQLVHRDWIEEIYDYIVQGGLHG